eukprot:gene29069-38123_t
MQELCFAAFNGNLPEMIAALDKGYDINGVDHRNGSTPLYCAAYWGKRDIAALLLDRGANPNLTNKDGYSPLLSAAAEGHLEVVALLLDRGANPNFTTDRGTTPLHQAVYYNHWDIVALLLQRGANPNLKRWADQTPLHEAAQEGHLDIVILLLEWGANPNLAEIIGMTPLHLAVMNGHRSVAVLLLEWGVNPNLTTTFLKKKTAMDVAKEKGGYSAADWNVVGLTGGGGVQVTVSAADNSGAGSIPTAALSMVGILSGAVVAAAGAAGTMTEELASLTTTQQTMERDRALALSRQPMPNVVSQIRVLDNRDLCRIISSFIPERKYRG